MVVSEANVRAAEGAPVAKHPSALGKTDVNVVAVLPSPVLLVEYDLPTPIEIVRAAPVAMGRVAPVVNLAFALGGTSVKVIGTMPAQCRPVVKVRPSPSMNPPPRMEANHCRLPAMQALSGTNVVGNE
jgi:hypothetical protein